MQAGATVQVAKNRLAKIALEGTDVASIGSLLKGPTLIAYSDDPVAAPKVAVAFAKDYEKFVILGGAMGKTALNPDGVKSLATMPSLDELRAKFVGLFRRRRPSSPSSRPRRPPSSRACSGPMPIKRRGLIGGRFTNPSTVRTISRNMRQWPIWKRSSTTCRA